MLIKKQCKCSFKMLLFSNINISYNFKDDSAKSTRIVALITHILLRNHKGWEVEQNKTSSTCSCYCNNMLMMGTCVLTAEL